MSHYYTNSDVVSNKKIIKYNITNIELKFVTDNGVFSKSRVDFGSDVLINTLADETIDGIGLDYGCGYGPIGISISRMKKVHMDMVDVNNRAIELARENVANNQSDNYVYDSGDTSFLEKTYDFVITNPPIRAGKQVVQSIFLNSYNVLKEGGVLYVVIQKKQGLASAKKYLGEYFRDIQTINRKAGFHILKVIK